MNKVYIRSILLVIIILNSLGITSCRKKSEHPPAVQTISVDTVSFLVKGRVTDVGSASTQYGFCYSKNSNPTLENSKMLIIGATSDPITFQTYLPALDSGNTYYLRAWGKNSQGTAYGGIFAFHVASSLAEYYYDNGSSDYGWRMSKGYDGYMGNLFPVNTSGTIRSVKVCFQSDPQAGTEMVQVEFFDKDRFSIGYTNPFTPVAPDWITISGLNIPFNGNFYAMVHWNYVLTPTNYLAMDQSGPNAYMDLAYIFFEGKWKKLSADSAGNQKAGNFLIHVSAQLGSKKKESVLKNEIK